MSAGFGLLFAGWPVDGQADQRRVGPKTPQPHVRTVPAPEAHPEIVLVRYASAVSRRERMMVHASLGAGAEVVRSFRRIPVDVVRVPSKNRQTRTDVISAYAARADVLYVEPNYRLTAAALPDDPLFGDLWGMRNTGQSGGTPGMDMGVTNVWAAWGTGSSNVLVAVIDTGMDYTHADLAANRWVNPGETANGQDDDGNGIIDDLYGARWTDGTGEPTSGDPMDGDGHGTHVAGTIGALGDNGVGVAGVNWTVRLMALKFLDDSGSGWTADAIAAIEYAIDKGAHISNNSWGGGGFSQALKDMIDAAAAADQLFVAAAGNDSSDNDAAPSYPASYASPNIVAVASHDRNGQRSDFSNVGRETVHMAAPGSAILSAVPGDDYATFSGTSMAAPHVTGAAALLLALQPGSGYADLKEWLMQGITPAPTWMPLTIAGGRLNVDAGARLAHLPAQVRPVTDLVALSEEGDTSVFLSWSNPTNASFDHVLIRRDTEAFPDTWTAGDLVYSGAVEAVEDGPHTPGTRLNYSAWAVHQTGVTHWVAAPGYERVRVGGAPDDYFTELFAANDNDLAYTTVTFIPTTNLNGYVAFADPATQFPTDPAGGTVLALGDDAYEFITLGVASVALYDTVYTSFYVGANGYLTFGEGDTTFSPGTMAHFSLPRIAALFSDFDPSQDGTVSWRQTGDRVAITYEGVPQWGSADENDFQVELFFDGRIRLTWLALATSGGLAGLSRGDGMPDHFTESDLSAYPSSDALRVTPRDDRTATGEVGGPFSPDTFAYGLSNAGPETVTWTTEVSAVWLSVDVAGGALAPGDALALTATIDPSADALAHGFYEAVIAFSNHVSGRVHQRNLALAITRDGWQALYHADGFVGTDPVRPALQRAGYAVTDAPSWSAFAEGLATHTYELAVGLNQQASVDVDPTVLTEYLAAGGLLMMADWTADEVVGTVLEAAYTDVIDQSPIHLTQDDVAAGVTNPLVIEDPGYGSTWSLGLAPQGTAQSMGTFPNEDAALVWGNDGQSLLLGFMADTVPAAEAPAFYDNLLRLMEFGGDDMQVTPGTGWRLSGFAEGPFSPSSASYTIANTGSSTVTWTAGLTGSWAALDVTGGSLPAGAVTSVTVSVTAAAGTLAPGQYTESVIFSNTLSGKVAFRRMDLEVIPLPGEIHVVDSVAPTNDWSIPFGNVLVGGTRTEQITVYNADSTHPLIIQNISKVSAVAPGAGGDADSVKRRPRKPPAGAPRDFRAEPHPDYPWYADTMLVGFDASVDLQNRNALHAALGTAPIHRYQRVAVDVVVLPKDSDVKAFIAAYEGQQGVAYAEPNYIWRTNEEPDDPRYVESWALNNTGQTGGTPGADMRAPAAWDVTTGSDQIIVAVIDTGIDYTHPDLSANMWSNSGEIANGVDSDGNGIVDDLHGARWVDGTGVPTSGDPMDGHRHGTHVAGTIGAVGNNAIGVAGVNWDVQLMALKFLADDGSGSTADALAAVEYAIDKGAHLSNNSWGGGGFSQALKDMIAAAADANQLFVAAAGNSASDNDVTPHYPSSYNNPNIVAVASSDHHDQRSSFSSFGLTHVDLAAPGSSILSTVLGGAYGLLSGTSMAAPHVAGAAALLLSVNPGASHAELKEALMDSVDVVPAWMNRTVTGGRLNLSKALQALHPHFRLHGIGAGPVSIAPETQWTFDVEYRPVEAGVHTGYVRIVSNDTNTPIVDVAVNGVAENDALEVQPDTPVMITGAPGGPFTPSHTLYVLTNSGPTSLAWSAHGPAPWLALQPASGSLAAGAATNLALSVTPAATNLAEGVYAVDVTISNLTTAIRTKRAVRLTVAHPLCEAVEACAWPWSTGGDAGWRAQTEITQDGVDAAQSGLLTHNQASWIETVVEGPGDLSFWWRVSSEAEFDYLHWSVNDVLQDSLSGEVDWEQKERVLPAGTHVIRWRYVKDGSVSIGADAGWIDQVTFTPRLLEDGYDHAGNYTDTPNGLVDGANGGTGFRPWSIVPGTGAVALLADSTESSGNINSANGAAFRFYGGSGNTFVDALRAFEAPLQTGDVFRVRFTYNWNGGARGVNLLAADGSELFNINWGGGDVLSAKWGNASSITLSTTWLSTSTIQLIVAPLPDNEMQVRIERNDGFSTQMVSSGLWAPPAQVKFYNGGHPASDLRYALHANELRITRGDNLTDGIPNWWWEQHGVAPDDRVAAALGEGPVTFADAYIADIDPTDPAARFPPVSATADTPGRMQLAIDPTSPDRIYRVEWTTNLLGAPQVWSLYEPEQTGTGARIEFTVTNDVPRRLYRTGVRLP